MPELLMNTYMNSSSSELKKLLASNDDEIIQEFLI